MKKPIPICDTKPYRNSMYCSLKYLPYRNVGKISAGVLKMHAVAPPLSPAIYADRLQESTPVVREAGGSWRNGLNTSIQECCDVWGGSWNVSKWALLITERRQSFGQLHIWLLLLFFQSVLLRENFHRKQNTFKLVNGILLNWHT